MTTSNSKEVNYAVFIENSVLKDTKNHKPRTALLGQIVRVVSTNENSKEALVTFLKEGDTWESTQFICETKHTVPVKEKLWSFLAAISSPQERVKLAKNRERCEKLSHVVKDMTVGFACAHEVKLGTVKYIGVVKGVGKCVGLQLHEKKDNNRCDGSCAGIQYFNCLPGFGVFATLDKISPINVTSPKVTPKKHTEFDDLCLESNPAFKHPNHKEDRPQHEEIITKYGEYTSKSNNTNHKITTNGMRNSQSLQNILDLETKTVNSNNHFDNNSVIPPDRTYLMHEKEQRKIKNKSEMDLIDLIGGTWSGSTDPKQLDSRAYAQLKNSCLEKEKNGGLEKEKNGTDTASRHSKNKTVSLFMNLDNGIGGGSKKNNFNEKKAASGNKSKFYLELNEKTDSLTKACTSKNTSTNTNGITTEPHHEKSKYFEPQKGTTNDLSVGSLVEVSNDVTDYALYGVVRWMGIENGTNFVLVGVELEEEQKQNLPLTLTDGSHNGERMFKCAPCRAMFVPLDQCHKDSRFQDGVATPVHQPTEKIFGEVECPVIQGSVAPLHMLSEEDVEAVCGKNRGIQGHHNSCYLDVTLFSMFTYTSVFDSLLFRPKGPNDIEDYQEVQRVLREEIVNPLRKNLYVSAGHVMNLRKLLDRLSSVSGLTSEEKDPEEFLNSLVAQILKAEPFLKLNSGQDAFYYQLFVDKDAGLTLPTVQQLFEQSFLTSNIKLKEVPSCLIVQMPRFGKNYKMYPRILPSQLLDVTDVIEGSPRQCLVCGKLALYECRECFDSCNNAGLENTAFCEKCLETVHRHEHRTRHKGIKKLAVSSDFCILADHTRVPRLYMELFAVICIETSHYVAFVKCGVGHEAPWCFFDSMADRQGERNGYNIPEMVACPDISRWLSDERICRELHEEFPNDRYLPEHARRLLCDAYICMYQSPDVMMYR